MHIHVFMLFIGWWRIHEKEMKWHGKYVFKVGRLMEERATKIGLNDAKIGARDLRLEGQNSSRPWDLAPHGRDQNQSKTRTRICPCLCGSVCVFARVFVLKSKKAKSVLAFFVGQNTYTLGHLWHLFSRVLTHVKGYKYPLLTTLWIIFQSLKEHIFLLLFFFLLSSFCRNTS